MFSFLKKKNNDLFVCLGVKYKEEGICPEDLDSCFEVFEKYFSKRTYTQIDIDNIIKQFGFNIHDYYVFIDKRIADIPNKETKMSWCYRWFGSKKISSEEMEKQIEANLSNEKQYTRVDIEKLSEKVGFSVYDRNNFVSFMISEYSFENHPESYKCILNNSKRKMNN